MERNVILKDSSGKTIKRFSESKKGWKECLVNGKLGRKFLNNIISVYHVTVW